MIWTHPKTITAKHADSRLVSEYDSDPMPAGRVVCIAPEVYDCPNVFSIAESALHKGLKVLFCSYKGAAYKSRHWPDDDRVHAVVHDESLSDNTHPYVPLCLTGPKEVPTEKRYDVFMGGRKMRVYRPVIDAVQRMGLRAVFVSDKLPKREYGPEITVIRKRIPLKEYMHYMALSKVTCIPLMENQPGARGQSDVVRAILCGSVPIATGGCSCDSTALATTVDNTTGRWGWAIWMVLGCRYVLTDWLTEKAGIHSPDYYFKSIDAIVERMNEAP